MVIELAPSELREVRHESCPVNAYFAVVCAPMVTTGCSLPVALASHENRVVA